jgi:hypothetical protein
MQNSCTAQRYGPGGQQSGRLRLTRRHVTADPLTGTRFRRGMSVDVGALLVDELLAQNVCVPAVLSEFTQHVEVHPSQRERTTPVALEHVIEVQ